MLGKCSGGHLSKYLFSLKISSLSVFNAQSVIDQSAVDQSAVQWPASAQSGDR